MADDRARVIWEKIRPRLEAPPDLRKMPIEDYQAEWLIEQVQERGIQRSLEVGFGLGFSAAALLAAGVRYHRAIEISATTLEIAKRNVAKVVKPNQDFQVVEGSPSQRVLAALATAGERFDLILLDGGHRFDDIFVDVHFSQSLLKEEGMLILDDTWLPSTKSVVSWMRSNMWHLWEELRSDALSNTAIFVRTHRSDFRGWNHFVPFRTDFS